MPKQAFAQLIISKLKGAIGTSGQSYNSGTPSSANAAIALACQEYIIANTKVNISYTGIMPNSSPDPITTDVALVMGTVAPPSGTSFSAWISSLESNIVSGLLISPGTALVTPVSPVMAFKKGISLSQGDVKSAVGDNNKNGQTVAWEAICDKIIQWINKSPSAGLSYPASHITSTGAAIIVKTIIV